LKKHLEKYSVETIQFKKGDYANYYFQIIQGGVKTNNFNDIIPFDLRIELT